MAGSSNLRCPALLPDHVVGPALAAMGDVFILGYQVLVQLADERRMQFAPTQRQYHWQVT